MATEEMNAGEIPAEETAAEDEAAMEAAKAAEKAEKEAAKAAAKAEKEAAKAAAKAEKEAARAARAEERSAQREEKKVARQAAAEERSEQKAAKQAEREAAAAQKKADQEAAAQEKPEKPEKRSKSKKAAAQEAAAEEEAESPAVSPPASVAPEADAASATSEAEAERPSVLPAKLGKEKKPRKAKKVKLSSAKGVRRAIRPIRSRTQQTTARLIWAVFGMALVIVAIVGFWLVISNQEDSTEVEVLVAAADLTEGNFVGYEDISMATIDIQGGSLAYLPSSNLDSLVGRVILRNVAQNTNLSLDMFGSSIIDDESSQGSEVVFELEFPSEATLDPIGINPGDRVVILIGQAELPERFAFEVVDVEAATENSISLEGSLDYQYWWEQALGRYKSQEAGVVFEINRVPDQSVPQLCWRERYRQIYQVENLPRDEYAQLMDELGCPEYFLESGAGIPIPPPDPDPDDTTDPETDGTTPSESVADRLERDRYRTDRQVPDEINNPAPTDGGGGDLGDLGDLGIDLSGIGFPEE